MSTRTVTRRTFTIESLVFKFSNLKELVETLLAEGFTSFEGLRLVSEAYAHMDGCDEYNIIFSKDGVDFVRCSTGHGNQVLSPFEMPDEVKSIGEIDIADCDKFTLYKLLDEHIREHAPYAQVFYDSSIVPSMPQYVIHDSVDEILSDDE